MNGGNFDLKDCALKREKETETFQVTEQFK